MRTNEIIKNIEENGDLDMRYIERCAGQENTSVQKYIEEYIQYGYGCSRYIAKKVALYYMYGA